MGSALGGQRGDLGPFVGGGPVGVVFVVGRFPIGCGHQLVEGAFQAGELAGHPGAFGEQRVPARPLLVTGEGGGGHDASLARRFTMAAKQIDDEAHCGERTGP